MRFCFSLKPFGLITITLCVLGVLHTEAQNKNSPWWRGFHLDGPHGPIVFDLSQLEQDEVHLVGQFDFENNLGDFGTPRSVVFRGEWAKGIFWPQVRLEVADNHEGPWKTIASTKARSGRMTVSSGKYVSFKIILDPFQTFIGKYKLGKVALTTGDEAAFSLSDLSPPPPPSVDDLIRSGVLPKELKEQ